LTSGPNNYVVQYGDTLLKIARRYGITSPALRTVNSLSSDTIYAGQVLFIPSPIPTTTKTPLPDCFTTWSRPATSRPASSSGPSRPCARPAT
jgi:LysM repeat protein